MRICYIADAGSVHIQKWVNFFARKGHDIHLISPRTGEGYAQNVQIHELTVPLSPKVWAALRFINVVARIIKLRRLTKKIQPDILDAHYILPYGYLAALSGFRPLVLTPWGSDILIEVKQSRLNKFLAGYALRRASLVVCDSETMKGELLYLGVNSAKIRKIYNGTDTEKFSPLPVPGFKDRLGISNAPVVVSTRNLSPVYNLEMLIKAVPLVLEKQPQTIFLVIGDGEQHDYLAGLAGHLGVLNNIRFTGWVDAAEVPAYLAAADIYVSTSVSDSSSASLNEAMACELAPVITDLPANREWIKEGENGFIVPQNDPQAMAEKIVYLIENEGVRERFGKQCRQLIKEKAEYQKEMGRVEVSYQEQIERYRLEKRVS